jgi:hypothetical protein
MPVLTESQTVEAARKTREIDERPSAVSLDSHAMLGRAGGPDVAIQHGRQQDEESPAYDVQKLEPCYLEAFKKHAAAHPNDLNFIVELASATKPSAGGISVSLHVSS